MAKSYTPITNVLDFQKAFNPAGAFPLDARSMFATLSEATAKAATAVEAGSAQQGDSKYYIGQIITVFENDVVTHYTIEPDKTLKEVGKSVATDNKTIVMSGEVLSLKDFGVQYYAYVPATDEAEASYELTQGWKAGLQPRVVANTDGSGYSLAWYEPSSTTVEGLNDIVTSMQGTVDGLDERIGSTEKNVSDNADAIAAEKERAEGVEAGLRTDVNANKDALTKLNADAQTEGSVQYQIAQAFAQLMENPDEAMNSIQELVSWAEDHAENAITLSNDVAANKAALAELKGLVGELPEGTQATDVIGYIQEAVAAEKARAEAAEKALQDKITALENANQALGTAAAKNVEFFATAEQGAKADTAVQSIVAGDNGHVLVDGNDVKVYEAPLAKTNVAGDVMVDGSSIGVTETGVISVVAVDKSKVTGLDGALTATQEAAVAQAKEAGDEAYVAQANIADSTNVAESVDAASDGKVISEKVFLDALTWKTSM